MTPFPNKLVELPESCHVGDSSKGPVLFIVLDGYGVGKKDEGDCIHLANPPKINEIVEEANKRNLYCELKAHGTAVGLPSDEDMGNSEVGHNALGCGQLVAQGAKLVNIAIDNGSMFESTNFNRIVDATTNNTSNKTVHFVGLLSDGGVHSHVSQLIQLVENMASRGVPRVRLHAVTDGRDVSSMSALEYVAKVESVFANINSKEGFDYKFASGGGRMYVTMDRYEADWNIVKRGWDVMVHGELDPSIVKECAEGWTGRFRSFAEAVEGARKMFPKKTDQDYPPWVIVDDQDAPVGKVVDGDIVVCFNYRGDRSIEIARAFEEIQGGGFDESCFQRKFVPKTDYYGLLIYDSEKMIPSKSLCPNPVIKDVLSEYLVGAGVSQYACSESHKIGHVTYFWNGNRSGYLDASKELYEEIKSEPNEAIPTNPAMRAREIGEKATDALQSGKWKFVRINLANGDMVGHTGHMKPTVEAVKVLDEVVSKLAEVNKSLGGITIITADHGNCEEMLDSKGNPKTSHTLNVVPFIIIDPHAKYVVDTTCIKDGQPAGLTNVAATVVNLFGFEKPSMYRDSLIRFL